MSTVKRPFLWCHMQELDTLRKKYENIENISESIYLALEEAIISGVLVSGTRLLEAELSELFGVSRTPIKEAIKRLLADELVIHTAQGGFKVREYSVAEICNIFEAVELIRQGTTRLAAEKITLLHLTQLSAIVEAIDNCDDSALRLKLDERFHQIICESTGNTELINFHKKLQKHHAIIRRYTGLNTAESLEANVERKEICNALFKHDKETAYQVAVRHSQHVLGKIRKVVDQYHFDSF